MHIESSLPFEALADAYRAADLVVFPSLYEGLGMIPIEAMASGIPVIWLDHGRCETVDGSTGAAVGDHDAFARVVARNCPTRPVGSKGERAVQRCWTALRWHVKSRLTSKPAAAQ